MALSKQSFTVNSLNLQEINDSLLRIQTELDRLAGVSGTIRSEATLYYVDSFGQVLHGWGAKP